MTIGGSIAFEDTKTVSYWIESDAWNKTNQGLVHSIVKGYCTFDKDTQEISFDPAKTDSFFFERKGELLMIATHLIKIYKKQKGFPDKYCIATGG